MVAPLMATRNRLSIKGNKMFEIMKESPGWVAVWLIIIVLGLAGIAAAFRGK